MWVLGAFFAISGALLVWTATLKIPDLSSIENRKIEQSLKIYDRTGTVLLYDVNKNIDRTIVPLSSVSPDIQHATIAMEDPTFYSNIGIEPLAILRAGLVDILTLNKSQGGSTLTQQVVRQTILSTDKTFTRKLKELVLSLKLTRVLPKDQILEIYLNQAPYGGAIYGVQEASEQFFGVPASDVTLPEAAYLAAILPAPTYYSPDGNHKDTLDALKNIVLDKMFEQGYITAAQRDDAKAAVVHFQPQKATAIQAPHFVFYVEQYLEQKYGADALDQNGWTVISTLDADLQAHAEAIVQKDMPAIEKNYNASNTGFIALDPTNGQILVMVGSRNYFDTQIDGNFNVTVSKNRQPGSTFKPFAYSVAFQKGYTPDTVLFDVPTQFSTNCKPDDLTMGGVNKCYSPGDFDGKWRGPMSLRDALAQSINVPSVEVLYLAGINDTFELARAMGISSLGDPNQYGLTLVLGGGEVSLLEMTSAYGTFATNGTHFAPVSVLQIKDANGNIVEDNTQPVGTQILTPQVTGEINDVLSDNVARMPEFGADSALYFPGHDVAVKTGTTNDYRDAWVIGYTPNVVVGSWAGNNDNTPMTKNIAGFILAPMWHEVMDYVISKEPNSTFQRSEVPLISGKPVLQGVWQGGDATIVGGIEQVPCNVHNILYWINKDDPTGAAPRDQSQDPQYPYWEAAVQRWISTSGQSCTPGSTITVGPAPLITPLSTSTPAAL